MAIDFSPYRLVPFKKKHEGRLIQLIRSVYCEYGQQIELDSLDSDLRRIREAYPPPASTFRVLCHGEELIGSIGVKGGVRKEAELKRVFLAPMYRGQGLGKKLSLWAYHWAQIQGFGAIHIWSDVLYETAHHLYRNLGALDLGERRILGGVNQVEEFHFLWKIMPGSDPRESP